MSILIKGIMNMPKTCAECMIEQEVVSTDEHGFPYVSSYRCPLVYPSITGEVRHKKRLINCPLLPLPEGHGRLIDANELELDLVRHNGAIGFELIGNAPTIVPAEGGGEDG